MKKLNILLVHNSYQVPGGEDTVFENEKNMLIENGHNIIEYTRNNNEIKKANILKKMLLPFVTIFNFKTYFEIKKIIKKERIDIVHVHNTLNLISPSVYYAAKKMKKPVIQTIHNFRLLCPNGLFSVNGKVCENCPKKGLKCALKNKCYRNSRSQTFINVLMLKIHRMTGIYKYVNFIFLTDFNKNKFVEYNKRIKCFDENKFYIKPNFSDKTIDKIVLGKNRKDIYIYAGRLDSSKGIKELVEFWKNINDTKKLVVYGDGPLKQWCIEYINNNNIKNINIKGFCPKQEVLKKLAESKALIMPTKLYEGFPMNIVESLSVGTPIIGNNIGNTGSIIKEGITGYKYDTIANIGKIINNLDKNNDIYDTSYKCYIDNYTKSINYEQLCDIYSIILK